MSETGFLFMALIGCFGGFMALRHAYLTGHRDGWRRAVEAAARSARRLRPATMQQRMRRP